MRTKRIATYSEFWPFYLQQHSAPITRALHYVGSCIAIGSFVAFIVTAEAKYLALMVLGSYAFAWMGHFVFEKNRPATFTYPWWSLYSDFRMFAAWLRGSLGKDLARAGVNPELGKGSKQ